MSVSKNNQLFSSDKKLNDLSNIKEFINSANSRLDAITSITNNSHAIAADAVTAMICENQDSVNSKISLNTTNSGPSTCFTAWSCSLFKDLKRELLVWDTFGRFFQKSDFTWEVQMPFLGVLTLFLNL